MTVRYAKKFVPKLLALVLAIAFSQLVYGQESRNPTTGLYELNSANLKLFTDVPIDDELRKWPSYLEQSIRHWGQYFRASPVPIADLKVNVYLISDRNRFETSDLLKDVPGFEEGYQFNNNLYLREQPSVYYRRHLFLHEATHWIMWRLYGGAGSPWFMEGMADLQGTHLLKDGSLTLGVIPQSPSQVPYWGRLSMIQGTLNDETAPTLDQILSYQNDRDRTKRYAWSWAACLFFTTHPRYRKVIANCYTEKLDYSDALSVELKSQLANDWDQTLLDWNGFISDLDFGYDPERSQVQSNKPLASTLAEGKRMLALETDRGWQSTGIIVQKGDSISINCDGRFQIRGGIDTTISEWQSEAQGISVEYHEGHPIGCVIASIQPLSASNETKRWETIRVGRSVALEPEATGLLFLKINEPSSELYDNRGTLSIQVR